jgi:hypothetical protein
MEPGPPAAQAAWPRRAIAPGSEVCTQRVHHHQTQRDDRPGREDVKGECHLASTQTLRPHLGS